MCSQQRLFQSTVKYEHLYDTVKCVRVAGFNTCERNTFAFQDIKLIHLGLQKPIKKLSYCYAFLQNPICPFTGKLRTINTEWRKYIPDRANDADCRLVKLAPDFFDAHLSGWKWDAGSNIRKKTRHRWGIECLLHTLSEDILSITVRGAEYCLHRKTDQKYLKKFW
jgi:hypothetical protein